MGLTPRATFEPISTTTNVVRQEIPAPQVIVEQPASSGTIVLYHAHSTENYSPNPTHARDGNVGDIGKVAQKLNAALEAKGYTVDYHADNFDVPDFSGAFRCRRNETVTGSAIGLCGRGGRYSSRWVAKVSGGGLHHS